VAAATGAFFDAQGCLSAEGFARIAASAPGQIPAELAAHLALCARCQRRLLSAGAPAGTEPRRRQPPPPWRIAAVVVGCIVLVLMALMLLRTLATPPM